MDGFQKVLFDNADIVHLERTENNDGVATDFVFLDNGGNRHRCRGTITYGVYSKNLTEFLEGLVKKLRNG
jgi:hypothetical protein